MIFNMLMHVVFIIVWYRNTAYKAVSWQPMPKLGYSTVAQMRLKTGVQSNLKTENNKIYIPKDRARKL